LIEQIGSSELTEESVAVGMTEEFVALVFLVVFAASQQPELLALPGTEECLLVYVVTEGWLL